MRPGADSCLRVTRGKFSSSNIGGASEITQYLTLRCIQQNSFLWSKTEYLFARGQNPKLRVKRSLMPPSRPVYQPGCQMSVSLDKGNQNVGLAVPDGLLNTLFVPEIIFNQPTINKGRGLVIIGRTLSNGRI